MRLAVGVTYELPYSSSVVNDAVSYAALIDAVADVNAHGAYLLAATAAIPVLDTVVMKSGIGAFPPSSQSFISGGGRGVPLHTWSPLCHPAS
jgi:hypothetical protein